MFSFCWSCLRDGLIQLELLFAVLLNGNVCYSGVRCKFYILSRNCNNSVQFHTGNFLTCLTILSSFLSASKLTHSMQKKARTHIYMNFHMTY